MKLLEQSLLRYHRVATTRRQIRRLKIHRRGIFNRLLADYFRVTPEHLRSQAGGGVSGYSNLGRTTQFPVETLTYCGLAPFHAHATVRLTAKLFPQFRQQARQVANGPGRSEDVIIVALDDNVAAIFVHELVVAALDVDDFTGLETCRSLKSPKRAHQNNSGPSELLSYILQAQFQES